MRCDSASSLCSCSATSGVSMPKCDSSWPLRRVSSAQTAETARNTCCARGDRSPRLPIGVATTCRVPGSASRSAPDIVSPRGNGRIPALSRTEPSMHISAKWIFTATLMTGLAGCASVEVTTPAAPEVVAPAPSAHWRFADNRPADARDGYRPPHKLAVLLPMTGTMATAAGSVRDGFLAGYYGERRERPELAFYDTAGTATGALAAHARAVAEGADQIVGPLGR